MSTASLPSISDYREAVQNPHVFLADPELKRCKPVLNKQGLPLVWSGGFAAVFQLQSPVGSKFAIKCFYRDIRNLEKRYAEFDNHLSSRRPGYLVRFQYQPQGILVNGQWFPIVRMEWVEGQRLDEFLQHHLQRPGPQTRELLEAMAQLWHRLAGELERDRLAHGDLQHGNVLFIPGNRPNSVKLRLVDYDGVWVPALDKLPSNESGQPNYQHPQRRYGPLMDRFPHLVIYTTLRCLMLDQQLARHFSDQRLVFGQEDYAQPGRSELFRELWKNCRELNTRNLVGHLILACVQPFEQTPRLQELVPDPASGQVRPLTALQQGQVEEVLRNGFLSPQSSATSVSFASTGLGDRSVPNAAPPTGSASARPQLRASPGLAPIPVPTTPRPQAIPVSTQPSVPHPTAPGLRMLMTGHEDRVECVAVTPDGRYVLSGSDDRTVRVWELATGREVRRFTGHAGWVRSVAVTPDGKYVVSGSGDNTVLLWELATGQEVRRLTGHQDWVRSVAVTPDGKYVVSASEDKTARLWDLATRQEVRRFTGHQNWVTSVAVTPDGKYVVSGRDDKTVRLWELATGKEVRQFTGHESLVWSVAVTPDGKYIVSGSDDQTVRVWELATGQEVRRLTGHERPVHSVAVTPDGRYVVSGSADKTVRVWDLATGQEVRQFTGHEDWVKSVAVTPDGQYVVSGSVDRTVRLWYLGDLRVPRSQPNLHSNATQVHPSTPQTFQPASVARDWTPFHALFRVLGPVLVGTAVGCLVGAILGPLYAALVVLTIYVAPVLTLFVLLSLCLAWINEKQSNLVVMAVGAASATLALIPAVLTDWWWPVNCWWFGALVGLAVGTGAAIWSYAVPVRAGPIQDWRPLLFRSLLGASAGSAVAVLALGWIPEEFAIRPPSFAASWYEARRPTLTITRHQPEKGPIAGEPFTIEFEATSPLGRAVHVEWRYAGEAQWRPLTEPKWHIPEVKGETLALEFRPVDSKGFTGSVVQERWKVFVPVPTLKTTKQNPPNGPVAGDPFTIEFEATSPAGRAVQVEWRYAGDTQWQRLSEQKLHIAEVKRDTLALEFRAVDSKGFVGTVVEQKTYVPVPALKITKQDPPNGPIAGDPFTVEFEATSPAGRAVHVEWRYAGQAQWQRLSEPKLQIPEINGDALALEFRPVDSKGFVGTVVEQKIYLPVPALKITKQDPPNGPIAGEPFTIEFEATSPVGRAVHVEWRYPGQAQWQRLAEPKLLIPQVKGDSLALEFRAVDSKGYSSDVLARHWDVSFMVRRFTGHEDDVNSVAVTPDGKYVVSGSDDKTVRLWDLATGQEVRRFTGHESSVWSVAVTPDGQYVVSGSWDNTVRLWELATGKEVRRFTAHWMIMVNSVAVTPDGQYVVSGSWDTTVRLWELATGQEVRRFTGHRTEVTSVAVTPDGQYVASGSGNIFGLGGDNSVRLWELATGKEARRFTGHEHVVYSVAVTPDGQYVVSGSGDKTVRVWKLATGKEARRFTGHESLVWSVAVTPDGQYVVSGSWDKTVRVWKLATGQEVRRFAGHEDAVLSVAVTPDGRYVVSGSEDKTIRVWYIGDLK